jgi:hypothetical protein
MKLAKFNFWDVCLVRISAIATAQNSFQSFASKLIAG